MLTRAVSFVATLAALLLLSSIAEARDQLVVTQWGGNWGKSLDEFVVTPFEEKYDVDVVILRQAAASDMLAKIRAERSNPTIDVYFAGVDGARSLAKEGLAVELTPEKVPALAGIYPNLIGKVNGKTYFAGINTRTSGLLVRRDLVTVPDDVSMKWLLSSDLKGLVAIPNLGFGHGLILLAGTLANGGGVGNIEPGFDYLKKLAPNVKALYRTSGDAGRMLSTGEVAVAYVSSGAVANLKEAGLDVAFYNPSDMPVLLAADAVIAVKGGPAGEDLALKFINFFLEPDRINPYSFGVGSSSPLKDAPPPPADKVPVPISNAQMASAFFADADVAEWIDANFDQWNERFMREIIPAIGQ